MILKSGRIAPPAWAASVFVMCAVAAAQQLEPRTYSPAPVGTNFLTFSYAHSSGDVLLDPSLPIQNADVQFNTALLGYYHSFGLFGRQTTVSLAVPYVWGSGNGLVNGVARTFTGPDWAIRA